MNNKKGAKLLAAIAVFAMIAAALVVVLPTSDVDAVATNGKYVESRDGPLNFADATGVMTYSDMKFDNATLGNQIEVTYDAESMTYYITGILAKQDLTNEKTAFKTAWIDNEEYLYGLAFSYNLPAGAGEATIKVGNGSENTVKTDDGCLLYIKETKVSTFTVVGSGDVADVVYSIDFTGVTLVDDVKNNPTKKYVSIANANALAGGNSGIDMNGGQWKLSDDGILTLTNYNGKECFDGTFTMLVLEGKNTITLTGASSAIKTSSALTIKSIDGVGSLSINMDSASDATAISSGDLSVTGVSIDISMTERYSKTPAASDDWYTTTGIGSAKFSIYAASLTIDVAKDNYYSAYGINASAAVDVKSTPIKISAGQRGINVNGDISIADSDVQIEADLLGIRAHAVGASVSITKESNVTLAVNGLKGGYDKEYGLSASGKIEVQSDSVLDTEGIIIYGLGENKTSVNNATIINNGDMVIWYDAEFQNAGKFTNNGVVGVYGKFINTAGEAVNDGVLSTYSAKRILSSPVTLVAEDLEKDSTTTLTITLKAVMPLADGTFLADLFIQTNAEGDKGMSCVGTMVFGDNAYTIDALTDTGIVTVDYKVVDSKDQYDIFASDYTFSYVDGKVDDKIKGKVVSLDNKSSISVTGGQLTNNMTMSINTACEFLVTGGKLVNNKDLTINANVTTTGGTLSGEGAVVAAGVKLVFTGNVDMVFTHSGKYTYTPTGASSSVTVDFTDVVSVVGKVKALTIDTTANSAMNGFIAITGMEQNGTTGSAVVTILQGSASFQDDIGTDMVLSVASGATLQILNKGAKAVDGVIAVQDGATLNMKITSDRNTFKYGALDYTITFANDGYTYYGSLQFALANAAEGATLNLNSDATITTDTEVKNGITLVFADKAKLDILGDPEKKITVSMGEGASFVLGKDSTVTFNQYATVSGRIIYDINMIVLEKVVTDDKENSTATIVGKAAGASTPSYIDASIDAVDGKVDVAMGTVKGAITIHSVMDGSKLKTTSKLTVAEGAVAEIAFADNKNAETTVNGTLKLSAPTSVNGVIAGVGSVVLKDGVIVTFENTASASITVGNGTDGFLLDNATAAEYDKDGKYVEKTLTFSIVSVAKSGTKAAYVAIYGGIVSGTVTAQGNTAFGNGAAIFTVGTEAIAVVPKDAVLTMVGDNVADGLVKVAGTLNVKVKDDSATASYGTLSYQITYTDGDYTVYTMLATGVANASAGDVFTITDDLRLNKSMDIPAGVTIIIAEEKSIVVPAGMYIAIGTPITTVGATSSIQGTISLEANAFVIVYADDTVDISQTKILNTAGQSAKNSQFTVLNEVYATVYVDITVPTTAYGLIVNVLVPDIDGFRFLGWNALTDEGNTPGSKLGYTDYEGNMKADMVKVTFQRVDGISYYVDNEKMNTLGAPVYVEYGATVIAIADAGYTGTPLVNGKSYITIDTTTTTIVGSGVSPAVDPTPEPEPEKDDGMALTDILLIVLVILAAILVIVVAVRMMRS